MVDPPPVNTTVISTTVIIKCWTYRSTIASVSWLSLVWFLDTTCWFLGTSKASETARCRFQVRLHHQLHTNPPNPPNNITLDWQEAKTVATWISKTKKKVCTWGHRGHREDGDRRKDQQARQVENVKNQSGGFRNGTLEMMRNTGWVGFPHSCCTHTDKHVSDVLSSPIGHRGFKAGIIRGGCLTKLLQANILGSNNVLWHMDDEWKANG